MRRVETALECPKRIACAGALDLDDIGAEVSKMHGGCGPGDVGAEFNHTDVLEES
jgi:hypothetical protein